MNCYCVILLGFVAEFFSPNGSVSVQSSHQTCYFIILTASSQYAHLYTAPASYFILTLLCRPPRKPCSLLSALLLLLSGYIQLNPGPVNGHVKACSLNIRSLFHENRSSFIHDFTLTHNIDVFAFTETWHNLQTTTPSQLDEAIPQGSQLFSVPRCGLSSGGGVAILCKDSLIPVDLTSFEAISVSLTGLSQQLTIFLSDFNWTPRHLCHTHQW